MGLVASRTAATTCCCCWDNGINGVAAVPVDVAGVLVEDRAVAGEGVRPGRRSGGVSADVAMGSLPYVKEAQWRYGVYWQGALYVHCRGEYVSR
jgi:hypothetical protein